MNLFLTIKVAAQSEAKVILTMLHPYLLEMKSDTDYPYLDRYWSEPGRI